MAITPKGAEPANIKKRMDTLFAKLDSAYPDKVICSLQRDHKQWAETVRELYRLLGYPDGNSFLEAYGYTVQRGDAGRPKTNNYDEVIEILRKRYPEGMPFSKISEIVQENPDLKGVLKTMQNNANELFGMSVKDYFNQIGLFGLGDKKSQLDDLIAKLQQRYPEGIALPNTVARLKEENPDLPMNRLVYSKEIYGLDVKPYLVQKGLVAVEEKPEPLVSGDTEEERNEAYLRLLAQRYEGKTDLPVNVTELANANPDIPVRKLNKYIRSKGEQKIERYYIHNRILRGKDTDLKEYTYCMLSFEETKGDMSGKRYAYLAGENKYLPGDLVVVQFGFAGWEVGEVKEVIRCLGIDAPWPVSSTKEILRKVRPDEMEVHSINLTAEDWNRIRSSYAEPIKPKEADWADAYPEPSESQDGTIAGFVLADQEKYQFNSEVDLYEESDWVPCQFRFRGFAAEVAKLKRYAKQNDIHISWDGSVSEDIREIRVVANDKTMELIEKFPALKVTGLAEQWWQQAVYVMYSESGFSTITNMEFGGYFDKRHDGGDGRWEWEYDMMEPINVSFTWLQTGDEEEVRYRYPFRSKWEHGQYVRELDGKIYLPVVDEQFRIEDGVLRQYLGLGGDVVIPDWVNVIDPETEPFRGNLLITSVSVPGTVSLVPENAFEGCTNLKKAVLKDGVTGIGSYAFKDCTELEELCLPDSLCEIGTSAFQECSNLDVERVHIPACEKFDVFNPFTRCKNVPKMLYSSDKTVLFYSDLLVKEARIPDSVERIHESAFAFRRELTSVTLPSGLKEIGPHAFTGCIKLQSIEIPGTVEAIGYWAFNGCVALKEIRIPGSVKIIQDSMLSDCTALETVIIEEGITEIKHLAFAKCKKLKHVYMPGSIKKRISIKLFEKNPDLVIHGYPGSAAEVYAKEKGFKFEAVEQ